MVFKNIKNLKNKIKKNRKNSIAKQKIVLNLLINLKNGFINTTNIMNRC